MVYCFHFQKIQNHAGPCLQVDEYIRAVQYRVQYRVTGYLEYALTVARDYEYIPKGRFQCTKCLMEKSMSVNQSAYAVIKVKEPRLMCEECVRVTYSSMCVCIP